MICTIFDFVETRLHLENPKKNAFSFGISLDLHYLCTHSEATSFLEIFTNGKF